MRIKSAVLCASVRNPQSPKKGVVREPPILTVLNIVLPVDMDPVTLILYADPISVTVQDMKEAAVPAPVFVTAPVVRFTIAKNQPVREFAQPTCTILAVPADTTPVTVTTVLGVY